MPIDSSWLMRIDWHLQMLTHSNLLRLIDSHSLKRIGLNLRMLTGLSLLRLIGWSLPKQTD